MDGMFAKAFAFFAFQILDNGLNQIRIVWTAELGQDYSFLWYREVQPLSVEHQPINSVRSDLAQFPLIPKRLLDDGIQ